MALSERMRETAMKTFRVTMAIKVDVYADSKQAAEELAADQLIEDHIPYYIVEMLDPVATELDLAVDITDGSWDPINDPVEYVPCPAGDIAGDPHEFIPGFGVIVEWSVMGDSRDHVEVCADCVGVSS